MMPREYLLESFRNETFNFPESKKILNYIISRERNIEWELRREKDKVRIEDDFDLAEIQNQARRCQDLARLYKIYKIRYDMTRSYGDDRDIIRLGSSIWNTIHELQVKTNKLEKYLKRNPGTKKIKTENFIHKTE